MENDTQLQEGYPPLPQGELKVYAPALGTFPAAYFTLKPHYAGLGYRVYDDQGLRLGSIPTDNVKSNIDNGFYILQTN